MNGSQFERVPPQNKEAEMSVLGSMMLSKDAIGEVVPILHANDFYVPANGTIFGVIMNMFSKGDPVDSVTVSAALNNRGLLDRVGGYPYIDSLVNQVPTWANVSYYAEIVREQSKLRSLVAVGTRIAQLGYTTDGADVDELINSAQAEVFAITEGEADKQAVPLSDIVDDVYAQLEQNQERDGKLQGLSTGFPDLDAKLNGLRGGQMIIVAARPGAGKSTLAMDFARQAAIHDGQPVAYFSLEMNRTELVIRLISAEASVFQDRLIKGGTDQNDWRRLAEVATRIHEAPLYVDDSPNLSLVEIRAKARRLYQQKGIKLIIIDYLQLLSSGGRSVESRQQEVSEFSRSIKLLAKELNIPIIAVAQLNRESEKRNDKRPQVADLRESGSLEQDADVVLLIHREDMYTSDTEKSGLAEVIVGKQRSGPTGTVDLVFQGHYARFASSQADGPSEPSMDGSGAF